MSKHVIFLGAGASVTSGFPTADKLTILMCHEPSFRERLLRELQSDGEDKPAQFLDAHSPFTRYYRKFSSAVNLLKGGDFATMDELSNLAVGGEHSKEIANLKLLMRFVFGLTDVNAHWAKSDYRYLIQKLFIPSESRLRDDITVISFNYDPYLEYRLRLAFQMRSRVRSLSDESRERAALAITSGFLAPDKLDWLDTPGFCHLKLHGVALLPAKITQHNISWPRQQNEPNELTSEYLFRFPSVIPRLMSLCTPPYGDDVPPVLLPWEIISKDADLIQAPEQGLRCAGSDHDLFPLFRRLWERARTEVLAAEKVSFVGLSAGPFLEPALTYLFKGKKQIVELVVANPENARFRDHPNPFNSRTLCGRLMDVLFRAAPGMATNRSHSEPYPRTNPVQPGGFPIGNTTREASEATLRDNFSDFIMNEL